MPINTKTKVVQKTKQQRAGLTSIPMESGKGERRMEDWGEAFFGRDEDIQSISVLIHVFFPPQKGILPGSGGDDA